MTNTPTSPGGPDPRSFEITIPDLGELLEPTEAADELQPSQIAMDLIDEAGMESFPCSDPPSYVRCHA